MWDVEPYTLDLSDVITISDDDLLKISVANPELRFERNSAGHLEIMSPSGNRTNACETFLSGELHAWNKASGHGVVFSTAAGFRLPNGAVRAPDVAWVRLESWNAISAEQQEKFSPITPDFIAEVRSPSDRLPALEAKMREWMTVGCRLAWLVDPVERRVTIYHADGTTEEHGFDATLSGGEVLPGFTFDLRSLPF